MGILVEKIGDMVMWEKHEAEIWRYGDMGDSLIKPDITIQCHMWKKCIAFFRLFLYATTFWGTYSVA